MTISPDSTLEAAEAARLVAADAQTKPLTAWARGRLRTLVNETLTKAGASPMSRQTALTKLRDQATLASDLGHLLSDETVVMTDGTRARWNRRMRDAMSQMDVLCSVVERAQ